MTHTNNTRETNGADVPYRDNVIDLAARRRGLLERRGADLVEVAVHLCAATGEMPSWESWGLDSDDDGGWAA
ncbi:hypothetical protein [Nocardia abscessus]|uniref:hypothetical protein n=1 Tax=Nocardia abscessus TaxID=120957 RepID=UPI002453849D|nr:hypothetical protein [Nocardia abscessus]